jgi:hypothetical protein
MHLEEIATEKETLDCPAQEKRDDPVHIRVSDCLGTGRVGKSLHGLRCTAADITQSFSI